MAHARATSIKPHHTHLRQRHSLLLQLCAASLSINHCHHPCKLEAAAGTQGCQGLSISHT
jgi:hypothetical protein